MKRKQKPNLAEITKPFENKWVALSPDKSEVVASGDTLEETESHLSPADIETVVFMKVPPADTVFIAPFREV